MLNVIPLLLEGTSVELELFTLEDVSINTTGLAGARRDTGEDTTSSELGLEVRVDLGVDLASGELALDGLGLGDSLGGLSGGGGLGATALAKGKTVVGLVPLTERSGIDLDDGGLGQGVGAFETSAFSLRNSGLSLREYVRTSSLLEGW